jgi:hypothetical protein
MDQEEIQHAELMKLAASLIDQKQLTGPPWRIGGKIFDSVEAATRFWLRQLLDRS